MANELALPASFGKPPAVVAGAPSTNDELGAGVASSYGVIGYRGKVWSIKFGGQETPLMREDGDGPRNSIEVILVKASPAISKIFYKDGYKDGNNAAPDCWSGNGVTPDPSVQNKVSPTCANCPMNAWGSRTTEAGKQAKACADSRRVAAVPLNDIDNELTGGPMLLRVPAASLKDLKAYGDLLTSYQYPYYAAATRISFDANEAFPKFVFTAIRPLTEAEVKQILAIREEQQVKTVLAERLEAGSIAGSAAEAAKPVPSSPFEQPVTATGNAPVEEAKPVAAKPKPAAKATTAAPSAADKLAAAQAALAAAAAEAEAEEAAKLAAAQPKPKTAAEKLAEAQAMIAALAAEAEAEAAAPVVKASVNTLLAEGNDDLGGDDEATTDDAATSSFDDMLEKIL